MANTTMQQEIGAYIDNHQPQWTAAADRIWDFAELRFEEKQSAALLAELFEKSGFTVERGVAGLETAFVAERGRGAPVIGFLGEYDALPGLSQRAGVAREEPLQPDGNGHACGHNLLGVGAAAAAMAAADYLQRHGKNGTVRFYGCPAEEGGGGKVLMTEAGLFQDLGAAITWHPSDASYVQSASTLATRTMEFRFHGKSAHAAVNPHDGRSALDAVELMNIGANYLREHIPSDARVHYAVTDTGGSAPNVVQARAGVQYQVRSPLAQQVDDIMERIHDIARGAALMTGTKFETKDGVRYPNIIPNRTLEACMQRQLEGFGLPAVGEPERVFAREIRATLDEAQRGHCEIPENAGLELAEKIPPHRPEPGVRWASTDLGDVSWVTPTVQFRGAVWAVGTMPHTWQAVAQGKSSFAHKGMLLAAKVMAATAVELFENPALSGEAQSELAAAIG